MSPIIDDLRKKDDEINAEIDKAERDPDKILILLGKRYKNYKEAIRSTSEPILKLTISSMQGDVINQMALFQMRKDYDEQIASIITRLDDLESKIQNQGQKPKE